jgi:hypothetical protein
MKNVGHMNDKEVIVVLEHPYGTIETTLEQWKEQGPGDRPFVRPIAAKERESQKPLPLSVIPLQYRNNGLSRMLIRSGLLTDPWRRK